MNNLSKEMIDDEGKKELVVAVSEDNYNVKPIGNYTLSNRKVKKESRLAKKFKGSILGSDIGIKSKGFSSTASLALVVALTVLLILFLLWRY